MHPPVDPPDCAVELLDRALAEVIDSDDSRTQLAAWHVSTVGQLGLLALAELAPVAAPAEALYWSGWLRSMGRALLGSGLAEVETEVSFENDTAVLTLDIASARKRLRVETCVSADVVDAIFNGEISRAQWCLADIARRIEVRSVKASVPWDVFACLSIPDPLARKPLSELFDDLRECISEGLPDRPRDAEILIARLGLAGDGAPTFQDLADRHGLTRERIRQIESSSLRRMYQYDVGLPILRHVARELQDLYAPFRKVDTAVAAALIRQVAGVTKSCAGGILALLAFYDECLRDNPTGIPLLIAPSESRHQSTGSLPDFLSNSRRILEDAGGSMTTAAFRSAIQAADWSVGYPTELLERTTEVLADQGLVELGEGQVTVPQLTRTAALRCHRLMSISEEAGHPLHLAELATKYDALVHSEAPTRPAAMGAYLQRYPESFAWCGPGTYGLASWGVGRTMSRDKLAALGLAHARRASAGDEVAALLYGARRSLSLAAIEDHVLARMQVNATSVLATLVQDKACRFVQNEDGTWGLRIWLSENEATSHEAEQEDATVDASPDRGARTLLSGEEQDFLTEAALSLLAMIQEKLLHGLPGVSEAQRFQWAILTAAVGDRESTRRLLRGFGSGEAPAIPEPAVEAVLALRRPGWGWTER